MRCATCSRANFPTEKICRYCGAQLHEVVDEDARSQQGGESAAPAVSDVEDSVGNTVSTSSRHNNNENVGRLFGKLFKWLLAGWGAFWVLSWSTANLKPAAELGIALLLALAAALISTVVYRGIKELFTPSAGTFRRADAVESEIAELRKKVEELSKRPEK